MSNYGTHQLWAGRNLVHDWISRGIDEKITLVRKHGQRYLIEVDNDTLDGLIFDTELQIADHMQPDPSWKRTCIKFLDQARWLR